MTTENKPVQGAEHGKKPAEGDKAVDRNAPTVKPATEQANAPKPGNSGQK